jgi:hypothetical protein
MKPRVSHLPFAVLRFPFVILMPSVCYLQDLSANGKAPLLKDDKGFSW